MNLIKETLLNEFNKKYSPNVTDNESEKIIDTINAKYEKNSQLATFIKSIINKRSNDPFIGSKIAGEEIFINLIEMLKNEKGVHAESLLAILGSLGGHECIDGIISALRSVVSDDSPDKAKEKSAAALLDILMVETNACHGEVLVGMAKIFLDLGFNVDVIFTQKEQQLDLFEKLTDKRLRYFTGTPESIRYILFSYKVQI